MDFDSKIVTSVSMSRTFDKQLDKVPFFIQKKIRHWILSVEFRGIWNVMLRPGLHDEPLKGAREGQRSVRLNKAYRLIYRVIVDRVHIELLEVHKHEY